MTTSETFDTRSATALPERVERRIERYSKPQSISAELAERCLPELKELVRRCEPRSSQEAGSLLSAGCLLLAQAVEEVGENAIAGPCQVFTDTAAARWSQRAKDSTAHGRNLGNFMLWMNQLVRAANGLPRRSRNAPAAPPRPIPDQGRLRDLAGELVESDPAAAVALVAAVGAGKFASAEPVRLARGDEGIVAAAESGTGPLTRAWQPHARDLIDGVADRAAWDRMRAASAHLGGSATRRTLQRRWALDVATEAETPGVALRALSRRLVEVAADALPDADEAAVKHALRG